MNYKSWKETEWIIAIVTVVLGVLFMALKGQVISIALTVLGAMLILLAVKDFIQKFWIAGAIKAGIGLMIIVAGWLFVSIALYGFAILLCVYGCADFYRELKDPIVGEPFGRKLVRFIKPVLTILVGVCFFFHQGATVDVVFLIAGIVLAVDGVLMLVSCILRR